MSTKFPRLACVACAMTLASAAAAPQALAAPAQSGFTISPGSISYSYRSPVVSVYAAAQVGNNKTTNVHQNSAVNISGVTQVGNNVKTTVVQNGMANSSMISQTGHNSSATVIQFGHTGSLLTGP